jgi:hypothetical protein
MSWSERYVQDHKLRTDCAIHRACSQLASDPPTFNKFQELLACDEAGFRKCASDCSLATIFCGHLHKLKDCVGSS